MAPGSFELQADFPVGERVADRVVEEIPHHLPQQRIVAGKAELLGTGDRHR